MTASPPRADLLAREGDWRAPVLNVSLAIAAGLGTVWLIALLVLYPVIYRSPEFVGAMVCFAGGWAGAIMRGWSERVRVGLLLFLCFGVVAICLEVAGPRPVAIVMTILFVLFALLYFGRNAGIGATVLVMAMYVLAAVGWTNGVLPRREYFGTVDHSLMRPWVTSALIQLLGVGAVGAIVTYVLDHARRTLRLARESEEKFAKAFRASPDAVSISDLETGRILEFNETAEKLFGHTREEAIGRTAVELGMWLDATDRDRLLQRLAAQPFVRGYRSAGRTRDGRRIEFEGAAEIIELGGRKCLVGILHDITERLRHEAVRERLERQVRDSQKLEALGTLAGGIAHDFNNLLMAIMNYSELARSDAGNPPAVREHIAEVLNASNRARQLVRQILAFSRKQPNERKPTLSQQVIAEALSLLRSSLPTTIEIKTEIDPACPAILADSSQLHQVMMNLGTNAAQAMRDRHGVLSVHLHGVDVTPALAARQPELKSGLYVCLTVADTGHGMSDATRARIFEPFFTTKDPGDGTGLGLAVVHGIVSTHEGAITVESGEGRGTTFSVYFPALTSGSVAVEAPASFDAEGRGERILVIDDEPAVCRVVKRSLERQGYLVEAFENSAEAAARLRAVPHSFGLVLTDLTMPQMTGIEITRLAQELRPGLPVLVMTGYSATWTRDKVREVGARDLLMKPISQMDLANAVRGALQRVTVG